MTRPASIVLVTLGSALLTALAYLGWLGWHAEKHLVPGTHRIEGPYESWQVIGLVLTLVGIVAVASWFSRGWSVVVMVTGVVTLMWAGDAATQSSDDASLWPIGAVLIFVGAALGLSLVSAVVTALRSASTGHASTGSA